MCVCVLSDCDGIMEGDSHQDGETEGVKFSDHSSESTPAGKYIQYRVFCALDKNIKITDKKKEHELEVQIVCLTVLIFICKFEEWFRTL